MSLIPNEKLLNYSFETYRVNLQHLSRRNQEVDCELFDWTFKNKVLHHSKVKAFGFHNNLVIDEYNLHHVYFISKDGKVFKTMYCENTEKLSEPVVIFEAKLPISNYEQLPPNLFFVSSEIACYVDGHGCFYVLNTFDRDPSGGGDTKKYWEIITSTCIADNDVNSTLLECRLEHTNNKSDSPNQLSASKLHCCLLRISTNNITVNSKNVELVWISYQFDQSKNLDLIWQKVWKGDSPPEMVTFSNDFQTLQIVSNHSFRYIPPDLNIDTLCPDNVGQLAHWCNETEQTILFEFFLNIPIEKFKLEFQYPTDQCKELVIFIILENQTQALELYRNVSVCEFDDSKTNWSMENELRKSQISNTVICDFPNQNFNQMPFTNALRNKNALIIGLNEVYCNCRLLIKFRKIVSGEVDDEIVSKKPKMVISGNEEVDDLDDSELGIGLFSGVDGSLMDDEISVSKNEWLFKLRLRKDEPFSACLRSNVDGLLWTKLNSDDQWTHLHTLNAFGYVAAAKVDRKFICCSLPDKDENGIKFAVITDWKRELYILMQRRLLDSSMTVKNRNTGQIVENVADEFLVTLEKSKEIMGVVANQSYIFVLYRQSETVTGITVINCS